MRDVHERASQQLVAAIAEHVAQPLVHAHPPSVRRGVANADRRLLERRAEPLLRVESHRLGALPLGDLLLELFGVMFRTLVEPSLRDANGKLVRYFPRDVDLFRGEFSRSAEAHGADQFTRRNHRHDHVRADARSAQRIDLGTRRHRVDVDHLRLAPSKGLHVTGQPQRVPHARPHPDAAAPGGSEPLHLA